MIRSLLSPDNEDYQPAPLRFTPSSNLEELWQGAPSVPYGIVRFLAFTERQKSPMPYVRVLFGEGGRRGDPWGSLYLEINGHVYHFSAGMRKHSNLHNGEGGLLREGLEMMAEGLEAELTVDTTDWRWIQDEIDVTALLSEISIERIATYFAALQSGAIPLPRFQSKVWAERLGKPLKNDDHNCTTIIATALNHELQTPVLHTMPLQVFNALREMRQKIGPLYASKLERELNALLWLPEADISKRFDALVPSNTSMPAIAKSIAPPPAALSWDVLMRPLQSS